jgi:hypothetical protein
VTGIERHEYTARFQHREQSDDLSRRAFEEQSYAHLRANSACAQIARQLIGSNLKLAIADCLVFEVQSDRVGPPLNLRFEQFVDRALASQVLSDAIALKQQPRSLCGSEQGEVRKCADPD